MVSSAVKKTLVGDYTTPIIPGSIIGHYIRILKNQPKKRKVPEVFFHSSVVEVGS